MIRRSMVLLMVLLAVALLTQQSALAAKKDGGSGSNYKAKVFALDSSTPSNSVAATLVCLGGVLSGSFFYQLNTGASFYGDISSSASCSLLTSAPPITATVTGTAKVESSPGTGATSNIKLQFNVPSGGHTFVNAAQTLCPQPLMASGPTCIMLTLDMFSGGTPPSFNEGPTGMPIQGTSATLNLSVKG